MSHADKLRIARGAFLRWAARCMQMADDPAVSDAEYQQARVWTSELWTLVKSLRAAS